MIIWLASYPRSGNTLLRTVLKTTMDLGSYSHELVKSDSGMGAGVERTIGHLPLPEPWEAFYDKATSSEDIHLVKTHHPPMDAQPAIYVVRDGRMATESYAAFQRAFHPDLAHCPTHLDLMLGDSYYGSWSSHYRVWVSRPSGSLLLLRYEQLVNADTTALRTIADFIGHTGQIQPFTNPFATLQQENRDFFRKGKADWQRPGHWSEEAEALFMELHGDLMQELQYITPDELETARQSLSPVLAAAGHSAHRAYMERNDWHQQARAKENVIQQLSAECLTLRARQAQPERSDTAAVAVEDQAALAEAKAASARLKEALGAANQQLAELRKALLEKEEIIRCLANAVRAYRLASPVGYPLRLARRLSQRFQAMVEPRLGKLFQYAPRPLALPAAFRRPISLESTPSVSIVTPSYQQGRFIERTMQSVLGQDYPALEYYVQDGGSTDETREILERYASKLAGWESRSDEGQSQAINLAFARTSGDIMAWINSDDMLLPGAIATVVQYFAAHPEVDVVYGDRLLIDENDMEIGRWILPGHDSAVLSWADYVPQETLFWRHRIWDKVGGEVDESFRFAMDWDLLVRFRDAGARFAHIPRLLGAFRIHDSQKTSAFINETGKAEMDRIRARILGREPSPMEIRRKVLPFLLRHVWTDLKFRLRARLSG